MKANMNGMAPYGLKLIRFNYLIIILLLLLACQNNRNSRFEHKDRICTDSMRFVALIAATIDLPNLQEYFEVQETLNQKELVILNNRCFTGVDTLKKFDNYVKLMSKTELEKKNIRAYLEYKEINIKQDTAYVYYTYDVQGLE